MKTITILVFMLVILMIIPSLSFTAYAKSEESVPEEDLSDILIPIPIVTTPETTQEREPQPLTPQGNLTLVDDIGVDSDLEKQFITVETKNGNFFYIVVDRAGDADNVHFLNMVDELDLFALLEDDEVPQPSPTPEPYIPPQPSPIPEPEPEPESSNGSIATIIVIIIIGGGGAGVYFKIIKPKQTANNGGMLTSIDEYDGSEELNGLDTDEPEDDSEENSEESHETEHDSDSDNADNSDAYDDEPI